MQTVQSPAERQPLPAAFHEYYDPNGYFGGDETQVLGWLYERRHGQEVLAQTSQGERGLTVKEQMAVELGHMTLLRTDNLAEWTGLGMREDELQEALTIAEFGVQSTVRGVRIAVETVKQKTAIERRMLQLGARNEAGGLDILIAGAIVAANAHKGQKRLNGADFYTHPVSAATLVSIATRSVRRWHKTVGVLQTRLRQYLALNHDATEDLLPAGRETMGSSFLNSPNLLATPLLHKRLLESYGIDESTAGTVAEDSYILTKTIGIDGRMENELYMQRFVGRINAALVKLADITHNLKIDPKEKPIEDHAKLQKWHRKRQTYERNIPSLQAIILGAPGVTPEDGFMASEITHVSKKRLVLVRKKRIIAQMTSELGVEAYEKATAA